VYAALTRLQRDGLVEVVIESAGGPEHTLFSLTLEGERRLAAWLVEPADVSAARSDEIVRKAVAILRTGVDPVVFLAGQRTAHLRRMRELTEQPLGRDHASRLARDHTIAHLDADLRWLELAVERVAAERA